MYGSGKQVTDDDENISDDEDDTENIEVIPIFPNGDTNAIPDFGTLPPRDPCAAHLMAKVMEDVEKFNPEVFRKVFDHCKTVWNKQSTPANAEIIQEVCGETPCTLLINFEKIPDSFIF